MAISTMNSSYRNFSGKLTSAKKFFNPEVEYKMRKDMSNNNDMSTDTAWILFQEANLPTMSQSLSERVLIDSFKTSSESSADWLYPSFCDVRRFPTNILTQSREIRNSR